MSNKLKALGLALFAAMAVSAVAVMGASAETGGHFVSDSESGETTLVGTEEGNHRTEFTAGDEPNNGIACNDASYDGLADENTVTAVTITPTYNDCETTDGDPVDVTVNGCTYEFTVNTEPADKHNTVHVNCPQDEKIVIHHPTTAAGECDIEIGEQTVEGAVYTNKVENEKHYITADFTIENIEYTLHNGFCTLAGTTHTDGELHGSATLKGFEGPNQVNITAT